MLLIYIIILAILFLYSLDLVSFQQTANIIHTSLLILIVITILDVITTPIQAKMKKRILCFIENRGLFFYSNHFSISFTPTLFLLITIFLFFKNNGTSRYKSFKTRQANLSKIAI